MQTSEATTHSTEAGGRTTRALIFPVDSIIFYCWWTGKTNSRTLHFFFSVGVPEFFSVCGNFQRKNNSRTLNFFFRLVNQHSRSNWAWGRTTRALIIPADSIIFYRWWTGKKFPHTSLFFRLVNRIFFQCVGFFFSPTGKRNWRETSAWKTKRVVFPQPQCS